MNVCIFMGRLTHDVELVRLDGGSSVARFSLACSRYYKKQKFTEYLDFQAWGPTAEFLASNFSKGDGIVVQGDARVDKWEKDGVKRRKVVFNAERVGFPESNRLDGEENTKVLTTVEGDDTPF